MPVFVRLQLFGGVLVTVRSMIVCSLVPVLSLFMLMSMVVNMAVHMGVLMSMRCAVSVRVLMRVGMGVFVLMTVLVLADAFHGFTSGPFMLIHMGKCEE